MNHYNSNNSMLAGRLIGIVLSILGFILTLILFIMATDAKSLPRVLVAGPVLLSLGLAMIIFPGGNFSYKDLNKQTGKNGAKRIWSDAPFLHKIVWIVMGLIGIVISFKIMIGQRFLAPL